MRALGKGMRTYALYRGTSLIRHDFDKNGLFCGENVLKFNQGLPTVFPVSSQSSIWAVLGGFSPDDRAHNLDGD